MILWPAMFPSFISPSQSELHWTDKTTKSSERSPHFVTGHQMLISNLYASFSDFQLILKGPHTPDACYCFWGNFVAHLSISWPQKIQLLTCAVNQVEIPKNALHGLKRCDLAILRILKLSSFSVCLSTWTWNWPAPGDFCLQSKRGAWPPALCE